MTLVLSEVSNKGVAMAADSAVTCDSGRVYLGAQKLQAVPQIAAGMSMWGLGSVGKEDTDVWLQRFIQTDVKSSMTLWDTARHLADRLNSEFGSVAPDRMGIHVCGFDQREGLRGPALYHVHNGHYEVGIDQGKFVIIAKECPPIREFRAHDDIPPQVWSGSRTPEGRRNGDICVFAQMNEYLCRFLQEFQVATEFRFPYPDSLSSRGEYLRFWINITINLYRLSNLNPMVIPWPATVGDAGIGGPVTVLTISDQGIQDFYAK